ncbi:MAG: site-specific integrase, partial [Rhizobiales bacterium]|nr:site-specific integrase [Hyphomicrobiales bacterium]
MTATRRQTRPQTRRAAGLHHLEAFLEMMSAERGASPNTLAAYRRDIEE